VRRVVVLLIICACALPAPVARAWTWPVDGPVLRPFSFDRAHPYAAGQHRGIDLGAPGGRPVLAPADGVVSFAGTVPTGGKTVSIKTAFGYTATLVHLGSISVQRAALVHEGTTIGTVGPSGVVDFTEPYVYFGVRVTTDDQGYVDPLTLLPARVATPPPAPDERTAEAPASASGPELAVPEAARAATVATTVETSLQESTTAAGEDGPAQTASVRDRRSAKVSESRPIAPRAAASLRPRVAQRSDRVRLPRSSQLHHHAAAVREKVSPGARVHGLLSSRAHIALRDADGETRSPRGWLSNVSSSSGRLPVAVSSRRSSVRAAPGPRHLPVTLAAGLLTLGVGLLLLRRRASIRNAARIMSLPEPELSFGGAEQQAEDSGRPGLALCGREASSGPRGRLRRSGGHLRAVPPSAGQRRPDDQWDRRARNARDGDGRSRERLAA